MDHVNHSPTKTMTGETTEGQNIEMLLVEDVPSDLELMMRGMRQLSLSSRVRVARDGAEALDFVFSRGEFDGMALPCLKVIVLDLNLPKVSGIDVLRQLKEDERTRQIPVVILTSSAEESDIRQCYLHGASSYLVKPVEYEKHQQMVSTLGWYWLSLNRPTG